MGRAAATSMVSRVEVAAAFARAVRLGGLSQVAGACATTLRRRVARFCQGSRNRGARGTSRWPGQEHGLRGYDAVQLASALVWQDAIGRDVVFATVDQVLMNAAEASGLQAWPGNAGTRGPG
ncbi:hypothetical protein LuPra_00809 [Luteitalea pratensis]|uniref:PIN domain-containing protein n=1 Tax=Luteitalea pratensis TaxID=1855912 RepID=A0A143PGH6_LUTPR|nr:hypothetical protein LuPra_00809 [Luteitalea pratensis]